MSKRKFLNFRFYHWKGDSRITSERFAYLEEERDHRRVAREKLSEFTHEMNSIGNSWTVGTGTVARLLFAEGWKYLKLTLSLHWWRLRYRRGK